MIPFLNLPAKIIRLFDSNTSPDEVAAGVCLGMFFGFIPLNGPMAILLFVCFLLFKINRLAAMLILPLFKLFYIVGIRALADLLGGYILIDAGFLAPFWKWIISLPVIAYLDINNTLVVGGLLISGLLTFPVYIGSKKGIVVLREKYFDKISNSKFVLWFKKIPIISKITFFIVKVRGRGL